MDTSVATTPPCSLQRALGVVGEKWTFIVLRDVFNGIVRFDDLQHHTTIARPVLAKRLTSLVDQGLLELVPYREEGQRTRFEYQLTQKGRDLYPVLITLREWGDRYLADSSTTHRVNHHKGCGAPLHPVFQCDRGHIIEAVDEIETASTVEL